jgi:hypothetical protein
VRASHHLRRHSIAFALAAAVLATAAAGGAGSSAAGDLPARRDDVERLSEEKRSAVCSARSTRGCRSRRWKPAAPASSRGAAKSARPAPPVKTNGSGLVYRRPAPAKRSTAGRE